MSLVPTDVSTLLLNVADARPVHFVGIAGAGMSALAELLFRRGIPITGCDAAAAAGFAADLDRAGITVLEGHDPAHVQGARGVVVTSAMSRTHPELVRARELGLPVVRRAEALGAAVVGGDLVAIAGTHGKTTTTVLTTEALTTAGLAPTGLAGGRVGAWGGNLRFASERVFVVEADEYDRSFLALTPTIAVVTNVEADHLDIYRDLRDITETFERFLAPARTIVVCADDAGAHALRVATGAEVLRYGVDAPDARVVASEVARDHGRTRFLVSFDGDVMGEVSLQVPGMHNVRNALAAIASGLALGATLDGLRPGLEAFEGVERRFQRLGAVAGVDVVDDYAHHPTEIAATLDAARATFPGRRLIAAFQPHLFTRTRDFATSFGEALARADAIFLTEIYPAREAPLPGVTSTLIEDACRAAGRAVSWRGERSALAAAMAQAARDGDVVITLGAGDITRTGAEMLQLLAARA
ncbi:MAG: UDP-N-acetylmuramate--L-alanine ligase [Gemmatimonadaceae bacterium]